MSLELNAIYVLNLKYCNANDCIEISEHLCSYITRFIESKNQNGIAKCWSDSLYIGYIYWLNILVKYIG
jgi:hypothetical protein